MMKIARQHQNMNTQGACVLLVYVLHTKSKHESTISLAMDAVLLPKNGDGSKHQHEGTPVCAYSLGTLHTSCKLHIKHHTMHMPDTPG